MKKTVIFFFLVIFWIFVLFPRDFLWKSFANELANRGVTIATKKVDISLYLLYNKIEIKDLIVLETFKATKLDVIYDARNPLEVSFDGKSSYGVLDGRINLKDKNGYVLLKTKKIRDAIFKEYFKKTKEGYKYEFDY